MTTVITYLHSVSLESIVCLSHTLVNNILFENKAKVRKIFEEEVVWFQNQYFIFKCFQENAFVSKIFSKSSGLYFGRLKCKWVNPSNAEATVVQGKGGKDF